jgi:hypothetical protein
VGLRSGPSVAGAAGEEDRRAQGGDRGSSQNTTASQYRLRPPARSVRNESCAFARRAGVPKQTLLGTRSLSRGTAQAHRGEVVDREVAHGVVERQLLAGVEADTAVGVAGVVDLRAEAAMERPGATCVACESLPVSAPTRKPTMTVSPEADARCGQNALALAVGLTAQLDALLGGLVLLASRSKREHRSGPVPARPESRCVTVSRSPAQAPRRYGRARGP